MYKNKHQFNDEKEFNAYFINLIREYWIYSGNAYVIRTVGHGQMI